MVGDAAGSFSDWQPLYAERGIATFPVSIFGKDKKPAISNYMKIGHPASRQLVLKFGNFNALGFVLGQRSRITVLDVDTPDEHVLADSLNQYGKTPIVVRSGSGNYQAWYKHNGETRRIRPVPDRPIDILGNGFVVAPPSRGAKGDYGFIQGGLDDLASLPAMRHVASIVPEGIPSQPIRIGARNTQLYRQLMKAAQHCDNFESLLDVARTQNAVFLPPLDDAAVVRTTKSAWGYTERGENRFGQTGAWLPQSYVDTLTRDPALCALIVWLKANNGPSAQFLVADGLCTPKYLAWPIGLLRKTRRRAIEVGWIVKIRHETKGVAALYRWGPAARSAQGRVLVEDSLSNS
jgi:hypothetical protein